MTKPDRSVRAQLERQREGTTSPLYVRLLDAIVADDAAGGPCHRLLAPWDGSPFSLAVPLRFLGAVHRLALDGRAPELAAQYPSTGGRPDGGLEATFLATVEAHADEIARRLDDGVQTNEVGRSATLLGGYLEVATQTGLPLRLLEIGTSAGLNLRWDHFRYEAGDRAFGDDASPVRFVEPWQGRPPDLGRRCTVTERAGCDPSPIDPASAEGRLTLRSYMWPDQTERLARLDAAFEVAARVPAEVERSDAATWLGTRLAEPRPGCATVIVHSIVWQYLHPDERRLVTDLISRAGRRASARAPLAWLRMEPGRVAAETRLTTWPGGVEALVATSAYHGPPVQWSAGARAG